MKLDRLIELNDRAARLEQKQADFDRDMKDYLARLEDFNRVRAATEALEADAEHFPQTLAVLKNEERKAIRAITSRSFL